MGLCVVMLVCAEASEPRDELVERRRLELGRLRAVYERQADAVVPIGAQAHGGGAEHVVAGAGHERRFVSLHAEFFEREAVGQRVRFVHTGLFGGDDRVPADRQQMSRLFAETRGAVGDDRQLAMRRERLQRVEGAAPRRKRQPVRFERERGGFGQADLWSFFVVSEVEEATIPG